MLTWWRIPVLFLIIFTLSQITVSVWAKEDSWLNTKSSHAIIYDYGSKTILYEKRAHEPMPPASMSKLMTVAVLFDALKRGDISLDSEFYVSKKAWQTGGSKMWVLVNTKIRVEDLIYGVIVQSGNDACIVVAENLAADRPGFVSKEDELGTVEQFVHLMNEKAKQWNLAESRFANPTGLPDPNQRMSAYDLAMLTSHIITTYPEYFHYFRTKEFTWSNITQENRNPLLKINDRMDGMKTGHTDEAGYGLVGTAQIDGQRRIIVLNGLDSLADRARESARIMEKAFNDFTTAHYYRSGDIVSEGLVFMGKEETVPLKVKNDIQFTLHKSLIEKAEGKIIYNGPLKAPIYTDQQVGFLQITMPGDRKYEYPLYTAKSVKSVGFLGKVGLGLQDLLTPPNAEEIQ
ncbi:MAG: D-alanyl-D-alanine carboxypeptidase family protein [bacterium]